MEHRLMPKLPVWATAIHGLIVVFALTAICLPQARVFPMKDVLGFLGMVVVVHSLIRLRRAKALGMSMREFSSHAPSAFSAAEGLELGAIFLGAFTYTFVL